MTGEKKRLECGMCTLKCVMIAYRRAPWFRVVREPMLIGMRFFAVWHNIRNDVANYPFPTKACIGCIRFYKTILFKKSKAFRRFHGWLNPVFNFFMERKAAREYAAAACSGTASESESEAWMKGMKKRL